MAQTSESGCEQFTVLQSRPSERLTRCDVCEQTEDAHPNPGRRTLSGGEVEALRRQLLMTKFDRLEQGHARGAGNGESGRSAE